MPDFFTTMSIARYNHLTEVLEAELMIAERCLGWHFCPDNEGKLITKQDTAFRNFPCNCKPYTQHVLSDDENDICV